MLFWTIIKVALRSLFANKLRSCLAMLGIIIGVGAVISMLSLGAGLQKQSMDMLTSMGTNLLVVRPGARGTGGVMTGTQQNLTLEDAEAIVANIPQIDSVSPVVSGSYQVKRMNRNTRVTILGTAPTYFPIRNFELAQGRYFTERETEQSARLAVLGSMTATNLFAFDDPVGDVIKLNGINFQVIGVLKSKGDQGWFNPDDQIVIPYTTGMKQVLGTDRLREIDIQAAANADITKLQEDTTALMRKRHRLQTGTPDDFSIRNQAELLEMQSSSSQTFTFFLGGIASISLLVGGIGIMNIMLVTVAERTREIGVRKAIGAKDRDILSQFLLEAMLMSSVGGIIGVAVGVGAAAVVQRFTTYVPIVQVDSVILALVFAMAVGVFFGYYPARRAARLLPVDALRYE